ncbi:MAG: hypothetical protein ACD_79C00230G0001 [uncultured bacterium]|nr:MAG: hypothetical protein ACD_79C00230G0001 [uncultured bacterium]
MDGPSPEVCRIDGAVINIGPESVIKIPDLPESFRHIKEAYSLLKSLMLIFPPRSVSYDSPQTICPGELKIYSKLNPLADSMVLQSMFESM